MDKPKLVDEFAALGLLRDDPPSPPLVGTIEAPSPALSEDRVRSVLRHAAASAGDCVRTLAEAMEAMKGVQEALQAVAEGLWGEDDEPTVEIEAEPPPPPVPTPVALADTAKLRAPVAALEAVIAPPPPEGEMSWVSAPAPFGVAEDFGAAAVMVPESVPLPPDEPPLPPPKKEE